MAIHGIKLKIKEQREKIREENRKNKKDIDAGKIISLKRSIKAKKKKIKELKLKKLKTGVVRGRRK